MRKDFIADSLKSWALVALRLAIGWHFLDEGLRKLLNPGWTAHDYLASSTGLLSGVFQWIAVTPALLAFTDILNVGGQIVIGLCLMLGLFSQAAALAGALMLALYYLAHPPAFNIVNMNLVEMIALVVLAAVPTGNLLGLDRLRRKPVRSEAEPTSMEVEHSKQPGRRELIRGLAGVPFVAALGSLTAAKNAWVSKEEQNLIDAFSGASVKPFSFQTLADLKEPVPKAKIRGQEFSRIILGGNIVCGFAHARDLIYVSKLVRAYHTPEKIFESLMLAEKCGINTILTHPSIADAIQAYWNRTGGKIKFLADCGWIEGGDTLFAIDFAIDKGASACYIQGEAADRMVREEKFDYLAKCFQSIRDNGLPVGIGAHRIATLRACVENGFEPDFWMKTFHPHGYWSERHPEEHDNKYCYHPEETIAFMLERKEPWIAFKTMAAGAIHPKRAFRFAFESGADFVCAGMYDFQMVQDTNIAVATLAADDLKRDRAWMA